MKLNVSILFIVVQLARIVAGAVSDHSEECGSLGVMSTDNLPEGITAANVRKCADHPLGHHDKTGGLQSLAPMGIADKLFVAQRNINPPNRSQEGPDACHHESPFGCSRNYCWKTCGTVGSGQWCWLAVDNGFGPWLKCTHFNQCTPGANTGSGCGQGCGAACGCSC